ncbi:MAG: WD40-like Beta Propeller Repeat protein [Methanomassiliicoccales archaeon PtaB.Bin134]|nr:MAG: WD40-like Beta Propeller Repeat protein [Methanomassiliicoccales archaeon PtaB.Bin134]
MKKGISIALVVSSVIVVLLFISLMIGTGPEPDPYPDTTREEAIPDDAVKMTPETDLYPPILHLDLWYDPIPLEGLINTAGAEDSAFITPDGRSLLFFFTPDPGVPPEEQLLDEVTGIWCSTWNDTAWSEPVRIWLQEPGKLALDGAPFVLGTTMWFASAREGFTGVNLFTATHTGTWTDWTYAGDLLNKDYQAGEMHINRNGTEMYFHSGRSGGEGQYDIWVTRFINGAWAEPENLDVVNSPENEGWPFLSRNGTELWFTRTYLGSPSIWRSLWTDGSWGEPVLVLSSFAAEPTMDRDGNLYFIHHYVVDWELIEADVYVAYRK